MDSDLKQSIVEWLGDSVDAVGFAPADRFASAPEAHRPERVIKNAATVVVLGKTVPRGILDSPDYGLYGLHRSYHTVYTFLDRLGLDLANFIEARSGRPALAIPTFAPMVYHDLEPWGIMSLKHAAVNAGLAAFGKSGLAYHPDYGAMLRLGAVVTAAQMPGDPMIEKSPCPDTCTACFKACPSGGFSEDGKFNKMTCLGHSVKHAIYPLALKDKESLKQIERIVNTAGYNYWLKCDQCLKVCPNHRIKVKKPGDKDGG